MRDHVPPPSARRPDPVDIPTSVLRTLPPPSAGTALVDPTGRLSTVPSVEPQPTAEVPAVGMGWSGSELSAEEPPFLQEPSWSDPDGPGRRPDPDGGGRSVLGRMTGTLERWPGLAALAFAGFLIAVIMLMLTMGTRSGTGPEDVAGSSGSLYQRSGVAPSPETQPPPPQASSTTVASTSTTSTTMPTTTTTVETTTTTIETTTTVVPVEAYPQAVADVASARRRTAIEVLANDTPGDTGIDPASLRIVTWPSHARDAYVEQGLVIYRPERRYQGSDYLEYEICDYAARCTTAGVTINVE